MHSIVVNKRYYDFDYDNNAIIMFDAEDVDDSDSNPLDWDVFSEDEDAKSDIKCAKDKDDKDSTPSADTLSSATSSPDTVQIEGDPSSTSTPADIKVSSPPGGVDGVAQDLVCSPSRKRKNSRVTWISSESGSARRIPFALQVAHSYTIKKLEMQHYQLVDTATVKKQEAARQQAKLAALHQFQHMGHTPGTGYPYYNGGGGTRGGPPAPYAGQQYPAPYLHHGPAPHGHYPPAAGPHGQPMAGHYRYPGHGPHGPPPGRQQMRAMPGHPVAGPQAPRMRYMPQQQPRKQDGSEYVTYRAPPRTTAPSQK